MSTRELCIVCGKAYVDDKTGLCPNGCTKQLAQNLKDALKARDLKRLEELAEQMEQGLKRTQANTWWQRQNQKRQKHGRKYSTPTNSSSNSNDEDTSTSDESSSGMRCPNCHEIGGHAEWCPWNVNND